ncbi:AI-2E family transporter [Luteimonas aestuarii]|uniref:AI-2E family transporter n=1 Tax=Luteimonas aestuarii TaxID=453837 RepID=A0A4R5U1D2_9GAMM|nr:AI-2E family transporter [Luteimonas aestuarii]TDK27428.1 AI-2E family transporter [Luteimonas aestuarii]
MDTQPQANFEIARFLKRLQWGLVAFAVLWVVYLLGPVLTPFVLAALLGWLGDPLVDRLEKRGRSRAVAVTLVFLLMALLLALVLVILVPMVQRQVTTLVAEWPTYQAYMAEWFQANAAPWIERITSMVGMEADSFSLQRLLELAREHWQAAGGMATTTAGYLFGYLGRSGMALVIIAVNVVLVPILTFYFLRDWDKLVARVAALVPRDHLATVSRLARESSESLGGFLRGQILVMAAQGAIYAVGMSLVGLRLGLLIGIIAGLISFVPYLGATVGILLALVAAIVQEGGFNWTLLLMVSAVFTIGQLVESYVLTPRLVGDKIGLHPVAVIFAVMAGGQLFGFLGMLLALPVAAVANVMLRYANERYTQSRLYAGDRPKIVLDGRASEAGIVLDADVDAAVDDAANGKRES